MEKIPKISTGLQVRLVQLLLVGAGLGLVYTYFSLAIDSGSLLQYGLGAAAIVTTGFWLRQFAQKGRRLWEKKRLGERTWLLPYWGLGGPTWEQVLRYRKVAQGVILAGNLIVLPVVMYTVALAVQAERGWLREGWSVLSFVVLISMINAVGTFLYYLISRVHRGKT